MNNFYKNIIAIKSFNSFDNTSLYTKVPDEWYIIITDIVNSTLAIENGNYKSVNCAGALGIVSVLNIVKERGLVPFVFGGDGATLLISPNLKDEALDVLNDTKIKVKNEFDLELRIGIVQVKKLYEKNFSLKLAKVEISPMYSQALIIGDAISEAERLIKKDKNYQILDNFIKTSNIEASFEGFECRWKAIKSSKDEVVSLIVQSKDENLDIYKNIVNFIDKNIGTIKERNPLQTNKMTLTYGKDLYVESKVFTNSKITMYFKYLKLVFLSLLGNIIMKYKIVLDNYQWGDYKDSVKQNSDCQKIENNLKMVFDTSKEKRLELENYLDRLQKEKKIIYGLHISDSSLMTCVIFDRKSDRVHFLDSTNGGYALAAKSMKAHISCKN